MKLTDFDFILPQELVAQYPLKERVLARLLVVNRKTQQIEHHTFKNIVKYFKKDDCLVLNDTKVMPARIFGKRLTGGKVELLLVRQKEGPIFEVLIKPGKIKVGEKIIFPDGINAEVKSKNEVIFNIQDSEAIYKLGVMPLPPYIKRPAENLDNEFYQTVYAKKEGAIASPTAGLHFNQELLNNLKNSGVNIGHITLHVGIGTFKPVTSEDILSHKMHPEEFIISAGTRELIAKTKSNGKRIIAVGTTSLRALETHAAGKSEGETSLYIYPGYNFKLADCLLTNFHLPKTTLFMLVCAFMGSSLAHRAYQEAIDRKYRFYSYGDCMLIL